MRLVALAALQAGWTALVPAQAAPAPSAALAPLAPGEVLLEVEETGSAVRPADVARVVIIAMATRANGAEARRAAAAQAERLAAAIRAVSPATDVQVEEGSGEVGFIGNEARAAKLDLPPGEGEASQKTAAYTVRVAVRDLAAYERIRTAAEAAGAGNVAEPTFALTNERPAREAAQADAIRQARLDADSYARTLGLRVARLVRVSERTGGSDFGIAQSRMILRMVGGTPPVPRGKVETSVIVDVDFALVPAG